MNEMKMKIEINFSGLLYCAPHHKNYTEIVYEL